jgi:hypothetical protein
MKWPALPLLLLVVVVSLTGCAGSGGKHLMTGAKPQITASTGNSQARSPLVVGVAPNHVPINLLRPARLLSPTRLSIFTSGSTGCPTVPKHLAVQSPDAIKIRLEIKTPPNGACLDNFVLNRIVVAINPSQIDVHHRLTIRLYYPKGTIRKYWRPVVVTAPPL